MKNCEDLSKSTLITCKRSLHETRLCFVSLVFFVVFYQKYTINSKTGLCQMSVCISISIEFTVKETTILVESAMTTATHDFNDYADDDDDDDDVYVCLFI